MKIFNLYTRIFSRLLLVTIFALLSLRPAIAQRAGTSPLKIGLGVSYFSHHAYGKSVPRAGISIGLAPTIRLSRAAYLKPEVAFSMKGSRIDYNAAGLFNGNVRYQLNYLDIPIVIGLRANHWLALEAGGYGAIKLGGSFDFEGTFAAGYGTFDRDDLHGFDYGPVAGVALQSRLLLFNIRYYYGLRSIAANEEAGLLLGDATNNSIQLSIQMKRFRKRKR
ncbi:MAG: PorT family protein [Niastella sp.]|nr:PorT family protein [Niastella sp.]